MERCSCCGSSAHADAVCDVRAENAHDDYDNRLQRAYQWVRNSEQGMYLAYHVDHPEDDDCDELVCGFLPEDIFQFRSVLAERQLCLVVDDIGLCVQVL